LVTVRLGGAVEEVAVVVGGDAIVVVDEATVVVGARVVLVAVAVAVVVVVAPGVVVVVVGELSPDELPGRRLGLVVYDVKAPGAIGVRQPVEDRERVARRHGCRRGEDVDVVGNRLACVVIIVGGPHRRRHQFAVGWGVDGSVVVKRQSDVVDGLRDGVVVTANIGHDDGARPAVGRHEKYVDVLRELVLEPFQPH
jgi:hypothetical protein